MVSGLYIETWYGRTNAQVGSIPTQRIPELAYLHAFVVVRGDIEEVYKAARSLCITLYQVTHTVSRLHVLREPLTDTDYEERAESEERCDCVPFDGLEVWSKR